MFEVIMQVDLQDVKEIRDVDVEQEKQEIYEQLRWQQRVDSSSAAAKKQATPDKKAAK